MRKNGWRIALLLLPFMLWTGSYPHVPAGRVGVIQESEKESESETETESESSTESESGMESEPETESETETETESETEQVRKFVVTRVALADENGEKIYDGSREVPLVWECEKAGEGDAELILRGECEASDVGAWNVRVSCETIGADAELFEVELPETELTVTILPKILEVKVCDGKKEYYAPLTRAQIKLADEKSPVSVSGFMKDGKPTEEIPEGFQFPRWSIDDNYIQQNSPMYENGKVKRYEKSLKARGGHATANYCFDFENHCKRGALVLTKAKLTPEMYDVTCVEGEDFYMADGTYWLKKGSVLQVTPEEESGFQKVIHSKKLEQSGSFRFALELRNKKGNLLAESQETEITFSIDEMIPHLQVLCNGNVEAESYYNEDVWITAEAVDMQTGCREIQYAVNGGEFRNYEGRFSLQEEGEYDVVFRVEDGVGNLTVKQTGHFVIDRTAPEIMVKGVEDGGSYRSKVAVEIGFRDKYAAEETYLVDVKKMGKGSIKWEYQEMQNEDSVIRDYAEVEQKPVNDGHYQLDIEAADKAGNVSKMQICFIVNRTGSVYRMSRTTSQKMKEFYKKKTFVYMLEERNTDEVRQMRLTMSRDGEIRELKAGKDYHVEEQVENDGTHIYTYAVDRTCFEQEGRYYLVFSSIDAAGNRSDSRKSGVEAEFVMDKTAPVCTVTGVETGAHYREKMCIVEIQVADNRLLDSAEVMWNGKVQDIENGRMKLEIPEKQEWQTLQVKATDAAGNRMSSEKIRFLVWKTHVEDAVPETETEDSEAEKASIEKAENKKAGKNISKHEKEENTKVIQKQPESETKGTETKETEENGSQAYKLILLVLAAGLLVIMGKVWYHHSEKE